MTDHEGRPQLLSEREAEIYKLRVVNRWTEAKIGAKFEVSPQRISQILSEIKKKMPPPDLADIRMEALALHNEVIARAWELVELEGAPVTVGAYGNILREPSDDGNGAIVRDFSGRIAALRTALEADKERRKLLGLDAATKAEVAQTVRYEVAGVDMEDLK